MHRASARMRDRARNLRKTLTISERRLWNWLRNRTFGGFKFRRQFPFDRFVLDFYCPELRLAIEVDGGQHETIAVAEQDEIRRRRLASCGVRVHRIPNLLLAKDSATAEARVRFWIEARVAELVVEE